MSVPITNPNKNPVSVTFAARGVGYTFDQATFSFDDAVGPFSNVGTPVIEEAKNAVSLTLQSR